jgi:hypothetical protein
VEIIAFPTRGILEKRHLAELQQFVQWFSQSQSNASYTQLYICTIVSHLFQ